MNRRLILLLALCIVLTAADEPTARSGFDPHYAFFQPDPRPDASAHSYYPADHDFTDYSQHITRTTILQKNSAASLPPSGPFFAHELRSERRPVSYASWNSLDYTRPPKVTASKISTPVGSPYGPPDYYDEPLVRPMNRPPKRKHKKKRPAYGGHHQNSLEKVSPGAQSIAAAYPNGVMGTLSVLAGVLWFLVNKSATPVVKMRSGDDSADDSDNDLDSDAMMDTIRPLDLRLASLLLHLPQVYTKHGASWSADCQRRATCEILAQYPLLSNKVTKSIFRSSLVQTILKTVEKTSGKAGDVAALFRAAADGQKGADCSVLYASCPIPFRMLMEARDR